MILDGVQIPQILVLKYDQNQNYKCRYKYETQVYRDIFALLLLELSDVRCQYLAISHDRSEPVFLCPIAYFPHIQCYIKSFSSTSFQKYYPVVFQIPLSLTVNTSGETPNITNNPNPPKDKYIQY